MKFEIEVDIPDGYEPTGEFRRAMRGERYLDDTGHVIEIEKYMSVGKYIILRKVPRTPTSADIGRVVEVGSGDPYSSFVERVLLWVDDDGFWCRTPGRARDAYCWAKARLVNE